MSFSWTTTPRPALALAPMAGVTDASYRQLIKQIAPSTIVYTEFLSTDAIHFGAKRTMSMISFDPEKEFPFIVQVFGKEPDHFLSAAKIIEQMGADGIDINMGCPAAKVVSSCHGSALIQKPELAQELVHATKKEVSIPVSVKTRLGWNTKETLVPFCQKLVEAGADALAIHGRTYHEKFSGQADWDPIYELKRHVDVPVLGNGDVYTAKDALDKIGNLDGVMVGRGTFGNPWLMGDIEQAFKDCLIDRDPESSEWIVKNKDNLSVPTVQTIAFEDKIPFIIEHCELAVATKGEKRGMLEMRKHLASYIKGVEGARQMREQLVRVEKIADVKAVLCG